MAIRSRFIATASRSMETGACSRAGSPNSCAMRSLTTRYRDRKCSRRPKPRSRSYNAEAVTALVEQARRSFTDLAKTGEGGEMLLFLLAERFLKLPHILCKMDLKTDTRMHYHGADGVYAECNRSQGVLKPLLGASPRFMRRSRQVARLIRDCLEASRCRSLSSQSMRRRNVSAISSCSATRRTSATQP